MKLEEDLFGFPTYPVDRMAKVAAGEPIPVSDWQLAGELPEKGGANQLTGVLETRLVEMLR